jgi:acyl-CoA synthetase (NDP forming)
MTSSSFLSFDSKNIFFNPQSIAVIGASEKAGVGKAI